MSELCPDCGLYMKAHPPSGGCPERTTGRDLSNEDLAKCMSAVERLLKAKFEGDTFRQACAEALGIQVSQVTDDQRRQVKIAAFSSGYSPPLRGRSNVPMLDDAAFGVPEFTSDDSLVAFLYIVLRDYLQPGAVEDILLRHIENHRGETVYSNGWLARYAQSIANRIRG